MVVRREEPTHQTDGGEGHLARGEKVEDHRKAPTGAGRVDPIARSIFGQPKNLGAISEERPVAVGSVNGRSRVEHSEVGHELDRGLTLPAGKRSDPRQEVLIREVRRESETVHTHITCVSRRFSRSGEGSLARQERRVEACSARVIPSAP